MTTWQVAKILNVAYGKATSVQNAVSGFRKADSLWPLTIDVFQYSDFAAATVTNVITEATQEHNPTPPLTPAVAAPAVAAPAVAAPAVAAPAVAAPAVAAPAVAMVTEQEHTSTPPLSLTLAPALIYVAMEAVPELCPLLPLPLLPWMPIGHGYNQRKELIFKHFIEQSSLPVAKAMV